ATEARVGSCQPEAGAADGLDQRRLAELRAQIRDVPVDNVQARRGRASPDSLQGKLPGDNSAAVEQEQLEQVGLSGAESEVAAGPGRAPRPDVEENAPVGDQLVGLAAPAQERAHASE